MTQQDYLTKPIKAGTQSKEPQEAKAEREREDEARTVGPIYDSRGRIVDDPRSKINAENYQEYLKQHKKAHIHFA
jgi:hypothetical protein